ncbi:chalcone isomerase-like protein 1 isoform X1 [Syzygium oleosum]|uniref:chalcone isomerase-like protein 1 isoform X1 n=1 Tax=Syzygium oleosum TaxID=219896 RepID=UPI0024B9E814|nr:chalcone isomerase-like protein 1 isoform X1 [Syzygium oleosum]
MAITAESEVKSQNNVASAAGNRAEGEASGAAVVEGAVSEAGQEESSDQTCEKGRGKKEASGDEAKDHGAKREEEVGVEVEPRTGVSFPVRQEDGKQLNSVGLRIKSMLGVGLKIYGFGIYADNEKLRDLLKSEFREAPARPTEEMYQKVIDSDVGMMVRLVIVFSGLTMSMVRSNFSDGLGGAIKKLTSGKKHEDLTDKVMGEASDDIKLTSGSVIEISRLPGYTLQIKVTDKVVSKIQSELLCRAYIYMYLGDDAFDMEAREKFGMSMLKLF